MQFKLHGMTARNKQAIQTDSRMESALFARNRQDLARVLVSYRTFPFGWAFRPYVYDSFSFEKWIMGQNFWGVSNQRDYLFTVVDNLVTYNVSEQWRRDKIERAKKIVVKVRELERDEMPYSAEAEIKKLIPE